MVRHCAFAAFESCLPSQSAPALIANYSRVGRDSHPQNACIPTQSDAEDMPRPSNCASRIQTTIWNWLIAPRAPLISGDAISPAIEAEAISENPSNVIVVSGGGHKSMSPILRAPAAHPPKYIGTATDAAPLPSPNRTLATSRTAYAAVAFEDFR